MLLARMWPSYCVFRNFMLIHFFFNLILQQILFHLSQITPRPHTVRLKESKSSRKTNKTAQNEFERLCQESLCVALHNFQASTNTSILELPLSSIVKQKPLTGSRTHTRSAIKTLDRLEDHIRTSYVSKSSFQENKAEPIHDGRKSFSSNTTNSVAATTASIVSHPNTFLIASNLVHQLSQPIFRNAMQIRGFKTHRNIESQLKRNPSFMSRIQQSFGNIV